MPCIYFSDDLDIRHVENLSIKYKETIWLSSHEMKDIRRRNLIEQLRCMRSNHTSLASYAERNINDTSTFMGLEGYLTSNTVKETVRRRQMFLDAVKDEQLRQIQEGINDPEALASVARTMSQWARDRARIIALLHA